MPSMYQTKLLCVEGFLSEALGASSGSRSMEKEILGMRQTNGSKAELTLLWESPAQQLTTKVARWQGFRGAQSVRSALSVPATDPKIAKVRRFLALPILCRRRARGAGGIFSPNLFSREQLTRTAVGNTQ